LTVLMPLSGTLGLLALPDVPMAFATALCLDAGARLLKQVNAAHALELAAGLAIGALSHYRFIGVIAVGLAALLLLPAGRRVLRDPRVWVALAIGAIAWLPLLVWNLGHGDAGLRFQFVDRHPWAFHADGFWFIAIQALLVTPLLFAALVQTFMMALRNPESESQWRYFGLLGGVSTLGFFVLGVFSTVQRTGELSLDVARLSGAARRGSGRAG
jgi:4-amino-4-deoxy-L-arabinose transferase and related glycosyltransferases of PMT family